MGPTALLPFRRKACCGFLSPLKIHRPRPGLNPRSLRVIKARGQPLGKKSCNLWRCVPKTPRDDAGVCRVSETTNREFICSVFRSTAQERAASLNDVSVAVTVV
jgi:hypothetical protein